MVHRLGSLSVLSQSVKITLLSMLFEFSSYPRHTPPLLLVRDYEYYGLPTLIKIFFSESHFVMRAIYIPSRFQPRPR